MTTHGLFKAGYLWAGSRCVRVGSGRSSKSGQMKTPVALESARGVSLSTEKLARRLSKQPSVKGTHRSSLSTIPGRPGNCVMVKGRCDVCCKVNVKGPFNYFDKARDESRGGSRRLMLVADGLEVVQGVKVSTLGIAKVQSTLPSRPVYMAFLSAGTRSGRGARPRASRSGLLFLAERRVF
jgi:hypothetical protein